ncbi:hypothetical protein LTR94_037380, partial [Friedmanniomyces endolithicus]
PAGPRPGADQRLCRRGRGAGAAGSRRAAAPVPGRTRHDPGRADGQLHHRAGAFPGDSARRADGRAGAEPAPGRTADAPSGAS